MVIVDTNGLFSFCNAHVLIYCNKGEFPELKVLGYIVIKI